jgi:hypothetical protein
MPLHAVGRADDHDCRVKDRQRAFHFRREINVARRVDKLVGKAAVLEFGLAGKNRDAARLLLRVGIEIGPGGRAQAAALNEKALGKGGFSRVNMCEDANGTVLHIVSSCQSVVWMEIWMRNCDSPGTARPSSSKSS